MDLFEERVLAVLNDGNPRVFAQLLDEVGFGRNTLKLRLKRLVQVVRYFALFVFPQKVLLFSKDPRQTLNLKLKRQHACMHS